MHREAEDLDALWKLQAEQPNFSYNDPCDNVQSPSFLRNSRELVLIRELLRI